MTGAFLRTLAHVAASIVDTLRVKDKRYGSSWKAKGGFSAFFNIDRKWSRVENLAKQYGYDIFKAIEATRDEDDGMEEALRDMIGYGLLILAETNTRELDPIVVRQLLADARAHSMENPYANIRDDEPGDEPGPCKPA